MTSIVRRGVPNDVEPMMVLLREDHAENGIAPLDEAKVRAMLMRGLVGDGAIVGVIRGERGIIEASVGLYVVSHWYSSHLHVEDTWLFVSEAYRKSEHAKSLLNWSKHAVTILAHPLMMSVMSNERTEAKVRLYARQLGAPVGAIFVVPLAETAA